MKYFPCILKTQNYHLRYLIYPSVLSWMPSCRYDFTFRSSLCWRRVSYWQWVDMTYLDLHASSLGPFANSVCDIDYHKRCIEVAWYYHQFFFTNEGIIVLCLWVCFSFSNIKTWPHMGLRLVHLSYDLNYTSLGIFVFKLTLITKLHVEYYFSQFTCRTNDGFARTW